MSSTERPRTLIIEAGHVESQYWRDLWRYRELFAFLALRDVLVRYKQTVFGVAWAWLQPLLTMLTFTLVFGHLAKLPTENVPYPMLVFVALLAWQFFSNAFSASSSSLIANSNLISKVYFPRLLVPGGAILVSFVDFMIQAVLLVLMMAWYHVWPDWRIVVLPFFMLLGILVSLGSGIWVAALNVKYRDFRYVVPFMIQLGTYISPVGFTSAIVPEKYRLLYDLNPMVAVIDGFRWALLSGASPLSWNEIMLASTTTLLVLFLGIRYFRKTEQSFADVI
jgi:lipopolysaccharide transport system permease protein